MKGAWFIAPEMGLDEYPTSADEVKFISDIDSLTVSNLKEWESFDFDIITESLDTAQVRVTRVPVDPYINPDPKLVKVSPSGMLSAEQAQFDIDAMVNALSQVHPNIFANCSQMDFFSAVNEVKRNINDSISVLDLYKVAAPIVAMIGDGHTNLSFPYNQVFDTPDLLRMPLFMDLNGDMSMTCTSSLDSIVPRGAKILSINGRDVSEMLEDMMKYVGGESKMVKLMMLDYEFTALFQVLFPAEQYEIKYSLPGSKKVQTCTLPAVTWQEIKARCPARRDEYTGPYSYTVDEKNNVAVMDFRSLQNPQKMQEFADSMFTELKEKNIGNLIIDVRENGGGNSMVGDVFFRYISPKPFTQLDKTLIRITPFTAKLMNDKSTSPMFTILEHNPDRDIQPLTEAEGHYDRNIYLLTSYKTFSSASLFAWTFKEYGMGTIVGEEPSGVGVAFGDILRYDLPVSDLLLTISYKRFWQVNADENDNHGARPDVPVPAPAALDKALNLIKKKH